MLRLKAAAALALCALAVPAAPAGALTQEEHTAVTADGWRLSLHRWKPDSPRYLEPVLLAHGFIESRRIWDLDAGHSLARRLAERGFDVWSLELRGSGRSQSPRPENPIGWDFSIDDFTRCDAPAAVSAVLARTGAPRLLLVGHSLGGLIVYSLLEGPLASKVAAAATLAGAGTISGGDALERGLRRFAGVLGLPLGLLPPGAPFPAGYLLHKTLGGSHRAWAELGQRLCSPLGEPFWEESDMTPALVALLLRRAVTNTSMNVVRKFLDYAREGSVDGVTDGLPTITAPVLAVAGQKDLIIPPADVRKVAGLCRAQYVEIAGAGHEDLCVGLTAPASVYPVVVDWLSARATPLAHSTRAWAPVRRHVEARLDELRPAR